MNKLSITEIKAQLADVTQPDDALLQQYRLDERKGVQTAVKQTEKRIIQRQQQEQAHNARLECERRLWQEGYQYIAGIDEVGRGPLAGPVVTATVILPKDCDALIGVTDSKQLSPAKRQHFVELIKSVALAYVITETSVETIDKYNIYEATRRSMRESVLALSLQPDYLLIDAMHIDSSLPQESLIKGDQRSLSIAAASILAKEYRDQRMMEYALQYPEFGFDQHMGYGTAQHLSALATFGYTPIHRQSFAPVRNTQQKY
ncbi:ribonuclease HII [Tuanshanicoccus lijuaniae]|uniref:ribonuclease HII n=1 Tax=Aerococcaceae bacterium zg-1292 TaxID=2774330 RepID=UPI001BD891AB|nr:ribonuclease HII [Aerococcaceae bacterium zg-A91]MBS4457647.1 ribonuclease HII [Aerococcaceae bacterium zg-BR33]